MNNLFDWFMAEGVCYITSSYAAFIHWHSTCLGMIIASSSGSHFIWYEPVVEVITKHMVVMAYQNLEQMCETDMGPTA